MRVLFSPVGTTDPIGRNHHDGSMLHICRYYHPDKVYLYLSKEMQAYEQKDHRFTYCLHQLEEQQGRQMEVTLIEKENLENVQDFNTFYLEFRPIIERILREEIGENDELLLNTSSGTPAMKSGLLVLQTIEHYDHCQLIQVSTPVKRSNNGMDQYDPEKAWETCADNDIEENRCVDIDCPALEEIQREDIIKKHIDAYDYDAALTVANSLKKPDKKKLINCINIGKSRLELDFDTVEQYADKMNVHVFDISEDWDRQLLEYVLYLQVRLKKGQYADFIRGITPIIVNLFELILKDSFYIALEDYCSNDRNKWIWDYDKLEDSGLLDVLDKYYVKRGGFNGAVVYSEHLVAIIGSKTQDKALRKLINRIHSVEEKIRNVAAHDILPVTDDVIRKRTGVRSNKILDDIKTLFHYTHFPDTYEWWSSGIQWKSYDRMNEMIKEHIR
jgi:CRISPR type III-A/MTUBE-associated protein Csm6